VTQYPPLLSPLYFLFPPSYHSYIYAFPYKPFFFPYSLPALSMNISIYRQFSICFFPFLTYAPYLVI
jgi:hypothetical protein